MNLKKLFYGAVLTVMLTLPLGLTAMAQDVAPESDSSAPTTTSAPITTGTPVVATGSSTCELNGQAVPCEELLKSSGGIVAGAFAFMIFMVVVGIASFVIWLLMLIHAIQNPIENKAMWILLMVFTGILGAIVYYFAVKRNFKKA